MKHKKKDNILITAPTLDFLLSYKSGISKNFLENGYNVFWNSPISKSDKIKICRIPKNIKHKLWLSPRKGILVFIRMIFSYSFFILKSKPKLCIISHTVYANLAAILSFYLLGNKNSKLVIFISGFGPSRIRNSLRIRLLGRIYLSFLRLVSTNKNIFIATLNFMDKNLIQDFSSSRKIFLMICRKTFIMK